jgi:hypothetical protein
MGPRRARTREPTPQDAHCWKESRTLETAAFNMRVEAEIWRGAWRAGPEAAAIQRASRTFINLPILGGAVPLGFNGGRPLFQLDAKPLGAASLRGPPFSLRAAD